MRAHTPGPWEALPGGSVVRTVETNLLVADLYARGITAFDAATQQANAHLIAASPDLLAFAMDVVAELAAGRDAFYDTVSLRDTGEVPDPDDAAELLRIDELIQRGRAAIAKAEGRTR